jgi:hypothetical protein
MKFDINAAREAGYSDNEIAGYLATENKFDLEGALKSGYSATDVVDFLAKPVAAEPAAAAPAAERGIIDRVTSSLPAPIRMGMDAAKTVASNIMSSKPEYKSVLETQQQTPEQTQAKRLSLMPTWLAAAWAKSPTFRSKRSLRRWGVSVKKVLARWPKTQSVEQSPPKKSRMFSLEPLMNWALASTKPSKL